ncbi:DEAD/DEAH box helicase [Verrucomicrobiota bacterium sgz303538]
MKGISTSAATQPKKAARKPSSRTARKNKKKKPEFELPPQTDWRTTDEDEINRRKLRAMEERPRIRNITPDWPVFSNFEVKSPSGMTYEVEIRSLQPAHAACTCPDFRVNGLGTCKHVEAVLSYIAATCRTEFADAQRSGSPRIDIVPDRSAQTLRLETMPRRMPRKWQGVVHADGSLVISDPADQLAFFESNRVAGMRISIEVAPWMELRHRAAERRILRRDYEEGVLEGRHPAHETLLPVYPYQREGMLHLAFTERALLADEMGLGKTVQAIAASALLHRLGKAKRVLVVTPASLKTEWEEQINRFTALSYQLVFGRRDERLRAYADAPFFTLVNYEQMLTDALDVNARLRPDIVILDEAQRIKNWASKTAQAVKRLQSRYAFVLTGTPIENRIDELRSIIDFLDPQMLGPLFRFNRDFYVLDDRGRPQAYKNLDELQARIRPVMLRRRKQDVETELPSRTDRNLFVSLTPAQKAAYEDQEMVVARLAAIARRRPLSPAEQERLMRSLAMMRMTCDTNYILDGNDRTSPKIDEIARLFDEWLSDPQAKIIVFAEWERMLELVRDLCKRAGVGYAWHTGTVPQHRRRGEILMFKNDPRCRVFLSTDSGGVGLNLQNASVVINCDLPWNPAKLEQRIARAWRKHQTRPVTVINLIAEGTIEHRMLETLSVKMHLAQGVLDGVGDLSQVQLRTGAQAFLSRLQQILGPEAFTGIPGSSEDARVKLPADRPKAFAEEAASLLGSRLMGCEERYPAGADHSVLLVIVDSGAENWRPRLESIHEKLFGNGNGDPLAPVHLEVVDRATAEALERLRALGLVDTKIRATRHLHPESEIQPALLTQEQIERVRELRAQAGRKLKMARLLNGGGFLDEAREPLLGAIETLGRALAIEQRLPEPDSVRAAVDGPIATRHKALAASLSVIVDGNDGNVDFVAISTAIEEKV